MGLFRMGRSRCRELVEFITWSVCVVRQREKLNHGDLKKEDK